MSSSRLFYYGTETPVELGDRVEIRRLFRGPLTGVVCYIPGLSPVNEELEFENRKHWAIHLDNDGGVMTIFYCPEQLQPPKKIRFSKRGPPVEMGPFV